MTSNRNIPNSYEDITAIFREQQINEIYFQRFYDYYTRCFKELYESEFQSCTEKYYDETGDTPHKSAFEVTNMYIETFLREKNLGHGDEWAHIVAYSCEENENALSEAYLEIEEKNPELAKKELMILCKSHGEDEHFEKHFIYLFEQCSGHNGCTARAKKYSKIYKEEISKGKSDIYAAYYAENMVSGEYNQIYCQESAYAYDKALKEGKNENYAYIYADRYGEAIVNVKMRGYEDEQEMIDFVIEKVNAYMNAWEYFMNNKDKVLNFKEFADDYEHIHLNSYFPDEGWSKETREELDREILEKTLEKYHQQK